MESPKLAVDGMFCSTKRTIGRMPPTIKCTNKVIIWATVSDVKKNEVT